MANDICAWIGWKIHKLRILRGWSQQILADHAQMNREHLSEIENGKRDPGAKILQRITNALEITMSQFFEDLN